MELDTLGVSWNLFTRVEHSTDPVSQANLTQPSWANIISCNFVLARFLAFNLQSLHLSPSFLGLACLVFFYVLAVLLSLLCVL